MQPSIRRWLLLALSVPCGPALGAPVILDVVGRLPLPEYQAYIAGRSYKDWGNEPAVTVNPLDPRQLVLSGFGYSTSGGGRASLWTSGDAGASWNIRFPVTAPAPGVVVPADWNFAYDNRGVLHGAALGRDNNIYQGYTANPNADGVGGRAPSTWQWTPGRVNLAADSAGTSDQPWIAVSGSTVHVGYDNFDAAFGRVQERVTTSTDAGATFTVDTPVSAGGKVSSSTNPGLRIATDAQGTLYALYGIGQGRDAANDRPVTYRLNRSVDGGSTWQFTNVSALPGGLVVAGGLSAQLTNSFGAVNELRGNITAVAAAPDGRTVYAAVGFKDPDGTDRIYLVTFVPDPANPSRLVPEGEPVPVSVAGQRAGLPALTVTQSGAVALLYDSFDGTSFHVHLATSYGDGFADRNVYDFTSPGYAELGLSGSNVRTLGDYQYLTSLGDTIYGAFAGRGNTFGAGVDTTGNIDPFFLTEALSVDEPASAALLAMAILGFNVARRRPLRA